MALAWDGLSKCADTILAETDTPTRVKVGGKDGKFVPNINASKWNDRAWLNINFPFTVTNQEAVLTSGVAEIVLGGWSHRYYVKANGNLEYEFTINKKPPRNTITLALAFPDGLEFWKQKSLEDDWAESHHGCSTFEQFVAASHKPDNVVGSYAVYWKEQNNGFKTGKFCHIFRPQITDADGKTVWADLSIDPVARTLTITVPQAWLNAAA
ncbi:MAG: hypothetical protein PHC46_03075 [Clostridia bacterium]|nr:hypothetical protein [Clostridia bacterium]